MMAFNEFLFGAKAWYTIGVKREWERKVICMVDKVCFVPGRDVAVGPLGCVKFLFFMLGKDCFIR